jgi:hypothetical protein
MYEREAFGLPFLLRTSVARGAAARDRRREQTTMKREDFVFTIGYQGAIAVVNKSARKKYGRLSTLELAEKGLYSQAFRSAIYSGDEAEMQQLTAYLREHTSLPADSAASLKRLFGVFQVPEGIEKTMAV